MGDINFNRDVNNIQIQQETQNSSQVITISDGYDKKEELISWLNDTLLNLIF